MQFADRAPHYDVVIVGAGIVGLAHAYDARLRGLRVAVLDRAGAIAGASIRNFGHVGVTSQSGLAREFAEVARERWLRLAELAGFWVRDAGALVVARADDEFAVLEEYREVRGSDEVVLLTPTAVAERVPVSGSLGGAWLPRDLQVDPREAAPKIAAWLEGDGVHFFWHTSAVGVESGIVHTARGSIEADAVIVAVNYDVDALYPDLAEAAGVERCSLEMVSATAELARPLGVPVLTGWSLARYSGFAGSATTLKERLRREHPELAELDVNLMYTQRPNGQLIIGDTHTVAPTVSPFQPERAFEAVLAATSDLFGTPLRVTERWQGVYAKAPQEFLVDSPADGVRVASVTTGIGMTTGLGLAASVMADLFGPLERNEE